MAASISCHKNKINMDELFVLKYGMELRILVNFFIIVSGKSLSST
jgi:hypothetical protein